MFWVSSVWRPGPSFPCTWPSLTKMATSSAPTVSWVIIRTFRSG